MAGCRISRGSGLRCRRRPWCPRPLRRTSHRVPQFTDARLEAIRAGMERRAREHLRLYLEQPFDELPKLLDDDALAQAQWIWRAGERGRASAPVGVCDFRRGVNIPADREMVAAHCALAADNTYRLFVNGKPAGQGGGFLRAKLFEVGRWLRPGANTLSVRVQNVGDAPNPAGLLAVLHVDFKTGPPLRITTDATWHA